MAFFAALAVFLAVAVTPANAVKPVGGIVKGPYLQQLTPDSIVIMWETKTAAGSRVDYGLAAPGENSVENTTAVKIHEIQLTDLAADTPYYYTVTSATATSAESTFATAPDTERSFRFVAYGDTRTNANAHAAVIQAIIASGPELVIHTGDLVESGNEYGQWGRQFFDPAYALMINTPLLPIIGNHEGSGNLFRDFFSLGNNDYWFAFMYGGVRFIGLNTHNASYSQGSTQYTWLEEELQSPECTSADWQIVYFHHPPYSSGSHGDTQGVKDHLVPLFEQYGVDMVFSGHDHHYERSYKEGVYYIVTGGGGAPLRDINLNSNPYQQYAESTFHHCVINVDVENSRLIFEARYNDGTPLDGPIFIQEPVDVTAPTASLIEPLDNGPDDLDADDGEVTVNTTQPVFDIQLSDVGDGIDDAVTSATVALTKDGASLTEGTDYSFSYDAGLDVITLTPAGGNFDNGLYAITLSGTAKITDVAGNEMAATTLSILIDTSIVPPVTLSFQQGVGGYIGMVDTMIRWAHPDDNFADSATQYYGEYQYQYNADTESGGGLSQILLRFDDIIGSSQIPSGSAIVSATLRIRSTDDGNGGKLHRMLQAWVDTVVTWNNSFGENGEKGVQADGSEAAVVEDDGVPSNSPNSDVDLDVTAAVQDWADEAAVNNGWAILPNGTNGWHMAAAEHPTLDYRPELIVTFITTGSRPPVADAGADQTVSDGEPVTLDGSASYDPDGTITAYAWSEGGSPLGTGATLTTDLTVGIHTVTLTVTDNEGATDSDDVVITVNPAPDTVPPTPDPMEWAQAPEATGSTSISMTAATASDDNGVEYYFNEISGNPGGSDSGWQDSSTYTDTGLLPNTTYTYTVKARDKSLNAELNVTAPSSPASAKTYQIGDFDHSRIIDWTDLRMFVDYWLDSCSSPSWCDERDINRSGRVSLPDFAEFARHWLEDNNP